MKPYPLFLALSLGLLGPCPTHAQPASPASGAPVAPVSQTANWAELTPAERDAVRAQYVDMPRDEEPPFPLAGLQAVYQPMGEVIDHYSGGLRTVAGPWRLALTVSPAGNPTSLLIIQAPDRDVARVIGEKLFNVHFKPGLCHGTPCEMDFPIDWNVSFR